MARTRAAKETPTSTPKKEEVESDKPADIPSQPSQPQRSDGILGYHIQDVVISVCPSVCSSDHNSGTLGPICLKFRSGNSE